MAAPWRLSSSSDEEMSSGEELLAALERQAAVPVRRRRGRPSKVAEALVEEVPAAALPAEAVAAEDPQFPLVLFRAIGSEDVQLLVRDLHAADVGKLRPDHQKLVTHVFGAICRPLVAHVAEAKIVGLPRRTFLRRELLLACALHLLNRSMLHSLISSVYMRHTWSSGRPGALRLVAAIRLMMFDETPLKIRAPKDTKTVKGPKGAAADVFKVLASQMCVSLLVQCTGPDDGDGTYHLLSAELPMPLQTVDKASGRNLYHALAQRFSLSLRMWNA